MGDRLQTQKRSCGALVDKSHPRETLAVKILTPNVCPSAASPETVRKTMNRSTTPCGQARGTKLWEEDRPSRASGISSRLEQGVGTLEHTHHLLRRGDSREAEEKPQTLKPYRVVSAAGHIPYDHIGDWQNLAVFRLLDEDGHSPGHQLAVVLYPLRPGDELAVRVVSWGDRASSQRWPTAWAPAWPIRASWDISVN